MNKLNVLFLCFLDAIKIFNQTQHLIPAETVTDADNASIGSGNSNPSTGTLQVLIFSNKKTANQFIFELKYLSISKKLFSFFNKFNLK